MSGKPGRKPGQGMGNKPGQGMTRLRTVWVTQKSDTVFEDEYTTLKQIGEPGQFGKAFQCRRNADGKVLAVKEIAKERIYRLHPSDSIRQSLLKSMQAEIDVMRRLEHKYIVRMYATYETKHTLHIVMEECKGGELFDRIKAKRRYPEKDAIPIVRMICAALFHMHDKHRVVHCDLKPDNILFADSSETSDIKIIDFGMSKVLPRLRSLRELCGTPYYTAPEIIHGDYSHAADMWSVGVIAYVMIFGFPPFYVDPNKYYGVKETKEIYKLIVKGFDPQIKKGYGAWFPKPLSDKLSKMGMDFMANLMEKDVAKRMTAKEALQHPWLAVSDTDTPTSSSSTLPQPSTKLSHHNSEQKSEMELTGLGFANFATSHKFKFAISALFRDQYEQMRPKHFENLKLMFATLDKDGNGKISYEEFEEGMLKANDLNLDKTRIRQIFKELDMSNAGEIAFENLLNAAVHDYLVASDVRLYKAFRDLDAKETGKIDTAVLKAKIRELNPYGNTAMILQIIDDVDLDSDGTIDYEEFLRALHPDFNDTPNWFWTDKKKNESDEDNAENGDGDGDAEDEKAVDNDDGFDYSEDGGSKTALHGASNHDKKKVDANAIAKQGWMQKEGKVMKTWRRRWFVLRHDGVISYFHNQNEENPIAQFSAKQATRLVNKSWSKSNKKRFGIKLYTPHRDWKFLCVNQETREEWIAALEKVSGVKAQ
eukprot:CAMPEP_0202686588 /NCGR_PEP_ID=MMETSP1385-20130828/2332_1 /ASSEMBLY_ACC=CAM_ASM_000861 /TAXON_ID=933848 /ORGANISM="Elphidium margaritaceum" /LENGTH=706 /DNA_ID=CAMNT_0049341193 /DNA_START=138 /DNA_END=2258 /DNA_ORIENTATION=+